MSAKQASSQEILSNSNVERPLADFPPYIWGDQFLNYHFDEMAYERKEKKVQILKDEVKRELLGLADDPLMQLKLIDAIQRLDVGYHFEIEIEEALQRIYDDHQHHFQDDNLYNVSLFFRILRQDGFNVSSDVFNKFKDDKGNFKDSLITDVRGMLELNEAAQLSVRGEEVLDEALDLTTTQLKAIAPSIKQYPLAAQVSRALKQKLRNGIPRLEAKHFMPIYQGMASHNKALLKLAKIDFNLLQSLHRKEISMLSRWWKDLGLAENVPFARDRHVESYCWALTVYFEPKYSFARCLMAKLINLYTVHDDLYDAFGTIEELTLFTDAIHRWDISCMEQLPIYMRKFYKANLDCFKEIEDEMAKRGQTYRSHYTIEACKSLVDGYFKEAQWCAANYIPTVEEHYDVSVLVTSTCHALLRASFVGMDETVTKETFEWTGKGPKTSSKMIKASSVVFRLMDDIVGHNGRSFEQKRVHVASSVECYMKQYGISEEKACELLSKEVANAWKDMNEAFLRPTEMPKPILMRVLNFTRVMDVIYTENDDFTHLGEPLTDAVTSFLIDEVPNDEEEEEP
ncbi:hypothetical protein FNV43_RR20426 [Rhamnella rubrinervis]|uniref:Uncharacterized protein n=1 Tax=Rhamnella rubrinervis TaxID=2594499 RepID=A0A8K0E1E8_9ROSA|nr:hypothetical protein FNV43_RR20426 [Rhamnella rubrinervis]